MISLTSKAAYRQAGYAEGERVRWSEKRLVHTLLCVADHHELLADVSTAVHWDEKLSHVFLHWVDLFREEHCRLCLEEKRERAAGVRGKKKRLMTCITICKNPHYVRPSMTDTGFYSGSALVSCSWHFLFRAIEVVVLRCAYSYSEITLHHSFQFDATRGALQRDPSGSFSHCLVCRTQLHMQASQSESVGSFTDRLLFTRRGQRDYSSYFLPLFPRSSLRLWEEFVIERKTESQWKHHLSKHRTYWHYRNNKCWSYFPQTQRDQ